MTHESNNKADIKKMTVEGSNKQRLDERLKVCSM